MAVADHRSGIDHRVQDRTDDSLRGDKGTVEGLAFKVRIYYLHGTFFYIFTVPREWKNTAHHRFFA